MDFEADNPLLPESVKTLISLIGPSSTLLFVEKFGGRQMVLHSATHSQELVDALGAEPAEKVFRFYGGGVPFTVPRCADAIRSVRNASIHAEFDQLTNGDNLSAMRAVGNLARKHMMTERQMWRILKKTTFAAPVDVRQMSLL